MASLRIDGDTRIGIESGGLSVAATTTNPSTPHASSGQGASSGIVVPDLALADVSADARIRTTLSISPICVSAAD